MTKLHSSDADIQDSTTDLLHILIAESNPVGLLVSHITALGWRVNSVTSGLELVNAIMAWAGSGYKLPDVLMVDWQMPKVDWLEALSILTENIKHQKLPVILIVSAQGSEHITKVDIKYLVNQILYKPISGSVLSNAVSDAVVKHTDNYERVFKSTHIEALKAQWLLRINLLVVDSNEINHEVVEQIMIKNGAIVTTLKYGQAALQQLCLNPNAFDIILMDVQMPEMDGIKTNQLNRQQLSLDRFPIVALTAETLVQEKKRAFDSGIDDFLTKPIEPFRWVSTVRKLVESYRSRVINVERLTSANVVMSDDWPIISGTKDSRDLLNSDENEANPLLEEVAQHLTNFRLDSAEFLSQKQYITDEHTETDIQNIPSISLEHIEILTSRLKRQYLSALTIVEAYSKSLHFILDEKN